MQLIGLLLIAIGPGILLAIYVWRRDILRPEPWIALHLTFWCGVVIGVVLVSFWSLAGPGLRAFPILSGPVTQAFLLAGLLEEGAKYAALRFLIVRLRDFDELSDGPVYGAVLAAGFATLENLFFVLPGGLDLGFARAALSIPLHVGCGALSGAWVARAHFGLSGSSKAMVYGLLAASLFHGVFNLAVSLDFPRFVPLAFMVLVALAFLVLGLVHSARRADQVRGAAREARPGKIFIFEMGLALSFIGIGAGLQFYQWNRTGTEWILPMLLTVAGLLALAASTRKWSGFDRMR